MSARPPREAATKSRKRVEEAYHFYLVEQDQDSDSDTSSIRPRAPRPTPVPSDESSDSDTFVDDSESDCPRASKGILGKKRKRSASQTIDREEERRNKAARLETGDGKTNEGATGYMVKSGHVMKRIVLEKAGRAPREWESSQHLHIRRAGLSDMGPETGSSVSGGRDEVWTRMPDKFSRDSIRGAARGPVDGNRYRVSRSYEHL